MKQYSPKEMKQITTPANPASGFDKIYTKSDDKLYVLSSGGTETVLTPPALPLAVANGGTGQDFSAEVQGTVPFFNGTGTMDGLAPGTAGQVLKSNGASANPSFDDVRNLTYPDFSIHHSQGFLGANNSYSIGTDDIKVIPSYYCSVGTTVNVAVLNNNSGGDFEVRSVLTDWSDAYDIFGAVKIGTYLYVFMHQTAASYRVYRYDYTDLASGGTLMTASGIFGSTSLVSSMNTDGTYLYFNYQGGNSANDYDIRKVSISGTTLTTEADYACGSTTHTVDNFTLDNSGNLYGLSNAGGGQDYKWRKFNSSGTLQSTMTNVARTPYYMLSSLYYNGMAYWGCGNALGDGNYGLTFNKIPIA